MRQTHDTVRGLPSTCGPKDPLVWGDVHTFSATSSPVHSMSRMEFILRPKKCKKLISDQLFGCFCVLTTFRHYEEIYGNEHMNKTIHRRKLEGIPGWDHPEQQCCCDCLGSMASSWLCIEYLKRVPGFFLVMHAKRCGMKGWRQTELGGSCSRNKLGCTWVGLKRSKGKEVAKGKVQFLWLCGKDVNAKKKHFDDVMLKSRAFQGNIFCHQSHYENGDSEAKKSCCAIPSGFI